MTKASQILKWYEELNLNVQLPSFIKELNPYRDMSDSSRHAMEEFYHRYYNDEKPRRLLLGINPGRLGAGVTGIPFTDSKALQSIGIIDSTVSTTETSAEFIWEVVKAYGGPQSFFSKWFIGAVSPLGFIALNERKHWVNYNYYDRKDVADLLEPFIVNQLKLQIELSGNAKDVVVLGTGKNTKALEVLNQKYQLFDSISSIEHPRFIMQYRRKRKEEYVEKFIQTLMF